MSSSTSPTPEHTPASRPPIGSTTPKGTTPDGTTSTGEAITYAAAGVDTEAGDRAVELMKYAVRRTLTPDVLGGVGGFAGLVDVSALKDYRRPLLATSTDGVGTKIAIARAMDVHDTIGQDLVAMVVDDIVVVGATPLLMTDYIACGKVDPVRVADIVRGIAAACEVAGVPLLGGETAEHPGLMAADEYDVAGAATGAVDADDVLGPERVRSGDVLLAMASSGLHSNGYSLVRRVVETAGWALDRDVPELGRTLGEELLEPTRLYTRPSLELAGALGPDLHAFTHVTGGGLAANLARVLPTGLVADVDRGAWEVPPVFGLVQALGRVPWDDLEGTLNLGVGMVAVLAPERVDEATALLDAAGVPTRVIGEIGEDPGGVPDGARAVSGTKGVAGGAVHLRGSYRAG
ncbi:phosphoribosylformylglycinamidine cyclo-ligase [Georgenia sp. Z1491]|uniref:phosphoribosylformylglycinamidine cyclo-ligase n=1 Tax=Georgenia sp. Z1491 TaxID=3416707 RepID=UPI003CF69FC2